MGVGGLKKQPNLVVKANHLDLTQCSTVCPFCCQAHVGGLSVHQCTLTDHPMLMKNCEGRVLGSQSGSQKEQHQSRKFTVPEILHVSWLHIKSKSQSHHEGETCVDLLLVMQHCNPAPLCTQRNQ